MFSLSRSAILLAVGLLLSPNSQILASGQEQPIAVEEGPDVFPRSTILRGNTLKKYMIDDPEAKCLDGTLAAYYFHPAASGATKDKWIIHHEGGGWCQSLDDCWQRSSTYSGTSNGLADSMGYNGFFNTEKPWSDWNFVYLHYCDGASFSGVRKDAVKYKGKSLYFRGGVIRKAFTNSLLSKHGLSSATDVIITGQSAGGLATFLHVDQYCDDIKTIGDASRPFTCVGAPGDGFFLDEQLGPCQPREIPGVVEITQDVPMPVSVERRVLALRGNRHGPLEALRLQTTIKGNYHCGLTWIFHTSQAESTTNQACVKDKLATGQPTSMCMFAEHVSPYITAPVFVLNSIYDSWQEQNVLLGDHTDKDVNALGQRILHGVQTFVLDTSPLNGGFMTACMVHGVDSHYYHVEGATISEATDQWYSHIGSVIGDLKVKGKSGQDWKRFWNGMAPYPCKECCKEYKPQN